jgi:hypothetical protein
MKNGRCLVFLSLVFMVAACATSRGGAPTGEQVVCPDGKRPLMDCRMAFEQYQRTLKFDLGVIQTFGTGIGAGIGAQPLISLDSITGDLLAHQQQICIEYNHCLISANEYVAEQRYLRYAQMKIRGLADTAKSGMGGVPVSSVAPISVEQSQLPGGVQPGSGFSGSNAILDEINNLDQKIQTLAQKRGVQVGAGSVQTPVIIDSGTPRKINIEYSLKARRIKSSSPAGVPEYEPVRLYAGATLKSGDQFRINFMTDGDGYVYVVNFDSQGKASIIFPHPEAGSNNEVKTGQTYEIPSSPAHWYYLDESKGQETLYIVASPFPIPNLDSLVSDLKQGKDVPQSSLKTARLRGSLEALTRGVGVAAEGRSAPDIKQSVMAAESINFNHE